MAARDRAGLQVAGPDAEPAQPSPEARPAGARPFGGHTSRVLPYAAAGLTILAAWTLAALFSPAYLIPPPTEVLVRLAHELVNPKFLLTVGRSFWRLGVGFGLASALGVLVGLATGLWGPVRRYTRGMVSILQSIPPVAWVPLFILVLGFGDRPIILVIVLSAFFPMAVGVMNAVEQVDPLHLDVARLMGAGRLGLARKVYAPAVLPAIITGGQIAFGNAWRSLIAAEMVGGVNVGLGWHITIAGEVADMTGVLAGIVLIGVLSAILDSWFLEHAKRRLLRWKFAA